MTPNSVVVRRQKATTVSSGTATSIQAGDDGVLVAEDANDYMITIMESAEGSDADEGDVVDIAEASGVLAAAGGTDGAITITASASTPITDGDQLKVVYAVTQDVADNTVSKTINRARGVKVTTASATAPKK